MHFNEVSGRKFAWLRCCVLDLMGLLPSYNGFFLCRYVREPATINKAPLRAFKVTLRYQRGQAGLCIVDTTDIPALTLGIHAS
jgi:hypothetical protein